MTACLLIDEESDEDTSGKPTYNSEWEGRPWLREADTANEDDSFEAFSKDSNEWQMKHGVLDAPAFEAGLSTAALRCIIAFERGCQLDLPLVLELGYAEQSSAHNGDDDNREEGESALPNVLGSCPAIFTETIEASDKTATDTKAYDEA